MATVQSCNTQYNDVGHFSAKLYPEFIHNDLQITIPVYQSLDTSLLYIGVVINICTEAGEWWRLIMNKHYLPFGHQNTAVVSHTSQTNLNLSKWKLIRYLIKVHAKSSWFRNCPGDFVSKLCLFLNIIHHFMNIFNIPAMQITSDYQKKRHAPRHFVSCAVIWRDTWGFVLLNFPSAFISQ